jgi:hypothetical protein
MIRSFAAVGTELTMTAFNKTGKIRGKDTDQDKTAEQIRD